MPCKELHTYGMENGWNIIPLWKPGLFSTSLMTCHTSYNPSTTDPAMVIARTDPNDQESVESFPGTRLHSQYWSQERKRTCPPET